MTLADWALKWNIPQEALRDLYLRTHGAHAQEPFERGESEAAVQTAVRLEASAKGLRLWRNNVGANYLQDGSFVRWGLANDSAKMNKAVKSADLIGIRPLRIEPRHVGSIVGQFVSREVKAPGWRYAATDRERAQERWAELILSYGGDAGFCTSTGTL